jgi:multiple sugar transport system substrate-binding protein
MDTVFNQAMSRRNLLRGGLGAAALAGVPFLAACGGGSSGSSGGGSDNKTVRFGVIKTWITPEIQNIINDFQTSSGLTVQIVPIAGSSGVELIQQFTPGLVSGKPSVDVMFISDESTPGFVSAGWLEPLDDIRTTAFKADYPDYINAYDDVWNVKDGHIYRLTAQWSVCLYFTQNEALKSIGAAVPKTWDDINALGAAAKSKGLYAFGDSVAKPALAFVDAAWLTLQAGGDIFDFGQPTQNAFQFVKGLMDKGYFPKEAIGWTYDQSNAAYTQNKIATMRQWNYFTDVASAAKPWYSADKATVSLPPAGTGGSPATYGGGWGLSVPKKAANVDGAKKFVAYMLDASRSTQVATASANWAVPRTSNASLAATNPLFAAMKTYGDAGVMKPRPFRTKINDAQSVVDDVFTAYLSGQQSLADAMSAGQSRIKALG